MKVYMLEINIVKYAGQLVRDSRISGLLEQDEPFWFSIRDPITENNDDFFFLFLKEFSWVFTSFFMLIVSLSTEEEN